MKHATSLLFLAALVSSGGMTQEVPSRSHEQAAIEVLELMDVEAQMLVGASAMADVMVQQNVTLAPFRKVLLEWAESIMTWEVFGPYLVSMYTEAFEESELREIAAFYRTPAGQKMLQVMPELMQRQAMLGSEQAQAHLAELEVMLRKRAAEIEKTSPLP